MQASPADQHASTTLESLTALDDSAVHCVITSANFRSCADTSCPAADHALVIEHLTSELRAVRRVLRNDGTLWLRCSEVGLSPVLMLPARLMMALQEDGWWLRSEIICAPDHSVAAVGSDAPQRSFEKMYLLSKRPAYFYDAEAVRVRAAHRTARAPSNGKGSHISEVADGGKLTTGMRSLSGKHQINAPGFDTEALQPKPVRRRGHIRRHDGLADRWDKMLKAEQQVNGANLRDVWEYASSPVDALASMPRTVVELCVLAGTSSHGVCGMCGSPRVRVLGKRGLDLSRPQTRRAIEIATAAGLNDDHLDAVRSVGVSDAGKNKATQTGSGRNTDEVKALAQEAKDVLGGYYSEFLLGVPVTTGWEPQCDCGADVVPATVLDPFACTTLISEVASSSGRSSILIRETT